MAYVARLMVICERILSLIHMSNIKHQEVRIMHTPCICRERDSSLISTLFDNFGYKIVVNMTNYFFQVLQTNANRIIV